MSYCISKTVTVSPILITRYLKLFLAFVYLRRNGSILYKQYRQKYMQQCVNHPVLSVVLIHIDRS